MSASTCDETLARVDDDLLQEVLSPYAAKSTIYLREAWVGSVDGRLIATGTFGINESCYIDDTGHFNAVEAGICYNQLTYVALAVAVRDALLPEFLHWTMADYWERQLPDILIYAQSMKYRRPIDSARFSGRFEVVDVNRSPFGRGILKLSTTVDFADGQGGAAHGGIDLALINVPTAGR